MVQHESALRAYLAAVYPTSRFEGAEVPYSAARAVFRSLELFYNISTLGPALDTLLQDARIELVRPPEFECLDGFYESSLLQRDPAQHYYARLLPCNDCFRRQFAAYAPCSTPPWVEVTHLAQWKRQRTASKLGWRDFFDVGPAMLWFVHTPGSGIWYKTGSSLCAPGKTALVAQLLAQWLAAPAELRSVELTAAIARRARVAASDVELRGLLARLRATANGSLSCNQARLPDCYRGHILKDTWDPEIITLARELKYDSLFMRASLLSQATESWRPGHRGVLPELVDLRPRSARASNAVDASQEEAAAAGIARQIVSSGELLTIRDPLAVNDEPTAHGCDFADGLTPTMRLGCRGHPSWEVRGVPRRQYTCFRRNARRHRRQLAEDTAQGRRVRSTGPGRGKA